MGEHGEVGDVFTVLGRHGITVEGMESERGPEVHGFRLELLAPPDADLNRALEEIKQQPEVHDARARGMGSPVRFAAPE
jgi:hypothetical protein